jgi:hypothetical protein
LSTISTEQTAAIKIAVPPQRLEANVALNSGGANLAVQHLEVEFADAAQGTATGAVPVSATFATGWVEFRLDCNMNYPSPTCPWPSLTLPAGTIVATTGGIRYGTLSAVTLKWPPPNLFAQVRIRAIVPGAAGNTGRDTIKVIENNPRSDLSVNNRYDASGGANARVAQVIQQSDVDAVQVALAARATYELGTAMMARANGLTYVVDGSPSLDFTLDRAVGDEAQAFTLAVTGKQGARAFSESEAKTILQSALRQLVLPGYELALDSVRANYQFVRTADSPEVTVSAAAVGYALPNLSMPAERARLKGLSIADAQGRLSRDFPGSSIDIRTQPFALPWLPLTGGHINLTVVVEPAVV